MTKIDQYLNYCDIELFVDKNPYLLNRNSKFNRLKLKALLQILDNSCSIYYIGFNNDDVGSDCYVIKIRKDYNLILKNKKDEWCILYFIYGSVLELSEEIDFPKLSIQYPRRIVGSIDVDHPISHFSVY